MVKTVKSYASELELATNMPGYVKIRLRYWTSTPHHFRNMLLAQYGAQPPFIEEVHILMPHMKVFPVLECFLPQFECLKEQGIISQDADIQGYTIMDLDYRTLAYIL